jgi:hypothetical protein
MKSKEEIKAKILELNLILSKNKDIDFIKDMMKLEMNRLVKEYKNLNEQNEGTENNEK